MARHFRFRVLALSTLLFLLCCGKAQHPGGPTLPDSGLDASHDGSLSDASDAAVRGPWPQLPYADTDVVLPYGAPPLVQALHSQAVPASADIVFLIDTTSSFYEEINNLQAELTTRIIPEIRARIEDSSFGVAEFEDFPALNFGIATDRPYTLHTAVSSSLTRVEQAVAKLDSPLGHGGDYPESGIEALWQVATGEGYVHDHQTLIKAYEGPALTGGGTLGGVGFREKALHVVIQATDASFHTPEDYEEVFPDTHSLAEAITALNTLDVFAIGIVSDPTIRSTPELLAMSTNAVMKPTDDTCPTGLDGESNPPIGDVCPLVFDIKSNGSGMSDTLVDAVVSLVNGLRFSHVYAQVLDDPIGFVTSIEATSATSPPDVAIPEREDLRSPFDGIPDTFIDVGPGVELTFSITLENTLLPSAPDYPHIFRVPIEIIGDGIVLTRHILRIIVPAVFPNDAGDEES